MIICAGQYSVFTAFLEQGDEVIMFEPFFDQYLPSVTFNGGKPVYVPLHPPSTDVKNPTSNDWTIDVQELRLAVAEICTLYYTPQFHQICNYSQDKNDYRQHSS
jgi:aspartate/methionine/tyrosine aminotransferase